MSSTTGATGASVQESIRAQIGTSAIDKIIGQPTTTSVNNLKEQIAKIAASVKTTKWGGRHGYLPLVLDDTEWRTASGYGATLPNGEPNNTDRLTRPPLVPVGLTNTMTITARHAITSKDDHDQADFWTQEAVDSIIVDRIVTEIIDAPYVEELEEDYVGYANQTIKTVLVHLKSTWCTVTTLEKKQAAEQFQIKWNGTTHITKYARQLDKQQKLCRDIGVPAHDNQKIQIYVEQMYACEMFDDKEMTEWEDKVNADKTWAIAKRYFERLYRSKAKYSEERAARAGGYDSANSLADKTRAAMQQNKTPSIGTTYPTSFMPPASVMTDTISPADQKTYIEYTNSLEGALEEAKEHVAAVTTDRDRMMEKINEQQKVMMEQQKQFMQMMMNAGMGRATATEGNGEGRRKPEDTNIGRGNPGKLVPPRKCGVCGKDGVRHKDEDCWENEANADKRPKWWKRKE